MKRRRFPGYVVEEFWFSNDEPSFVRWEPNLASAYRSADYLTRHHFHRDEPRYWVTISVTRLVDHRRMP